MVSGGLWSVVGVTYSAERRLRTGDRGGEANVGVGSRVDNADAPVSPRSSPPKLLDFLRGRSFGEEDILDLGIFSNR